MKRIASILILLSLGCSSTVSTTPVISTPSPDSSFLQEDSSVDLTPYQQILDSSVESGSSVSLREIFNEERARDAGAFAIPMLRNPQTSPADQTVYGPWNGICLNEPAINHLTVSLGEITRTIDANHRLAIATLATTAIRDVSILNSDMRLMRAFYQAQVRSRDIELTSAERTIQALERTGQRSPWVYVGLVGAGVLLGVGVSAAIVLSQ
jgi:hypothetical protein